MSKPIDTSWSFRDAAILRLADVAVSWRGGRRGTLPCLSYEIMVFPVGPRETLVAGTRV